jgi:hypothetical protein
MPKAEILDLVDFLSRGLVTEGTASYYYDQIKRELAMADVVVHVNLLTNQAGPIYTYPAEATKLIAVWYDNAQILPAAKDDLVQEWRDDVGDPVAFIREDEDARTFRVYPAPDVAPAPLIPLFGAPLGKDYPVANMAIMSTVIIDDFPAWLDLAIAFDILSREFVRDSEYKDTAFAKSCKDFAGTLYKILLT